MVIAIIRIYARKVNRPEETAMEKHSTQSKKVQVIHVGIDVHKNSWRVTEMRDGVALKTYSATPSAAELGARLRREYPGAEYRSVYEAGFCGFHVHRELEAQGVRNIVINAADVPTSGKERANKNDTVDSRKLARELANGSLEPIYVPSPANLLLRGVVRCETLTVKDVTREINRMKSILAQRGEEPPRINGGALKLRLEQAVLAGDEEMALAVGRLMARRSERAKAVQAERRTVEALGLRPLVHRLMTVPGVGFRTAVVVLSEIWDMSRFPTENHLVSFAGLAPRLTGSGEHERTGGIGHRKHRLLQGILIEAAWTAGRKDAELHDKYWTMAMRKTVQKAVVAVARRLLMRIRAVWLHGTDYVPRQPADKTGCAENDGQGK